MKLNRVKRINAALLVAIITALVGGSIQAGSAQTNEEAAVREALNHAAISFEKNDIAMASRVWGDDESVTVFESGHANYGWKDYRDNHLLPEMSEMKNTKYAFSDMSVHLAGNTAWATMKYTIAADVPDGSKTRHIEGGGLATAILEKRDGRWQIIHWHSSAPRRPPATPAKNP